MTSPSLLHVPKKSESEARMQAALKVARERLTYGRRERDPYHASQYYEDGIERIVDILEDGRS